MSPLPTASEQHLQQSPLLTEIVRRLVTSFHPERIYLFGSRARGEAGQESDFDLAVIVPDSSLPRHRRDQEAFRALIGVGASKDIVVFTREEFDRKRTVVCSLPATIEREGLLLYES
jgi:predicted nucleotidyltransferase